MMFLRFVALAILSVLPFAEDRARLITGGPVQFIFSIRPTPFKP